jgi:hypothetical protein
MSRDGRYEQLVDMIETKEETGTSKYRKAFVHYEKKQPAVAARFCVYSSVVNILSRRTLGGNSQFSSISGLIWQDPKRGGPDALSSLVHV